MCKVLGITNVSKLNQTELKNLVEQSAKIMQGQRDGFGWALSVVNNSGKVRKLGERTNKIEKFVTRFQSKPVDLPFIEQWSNIFGDDIASDEKPRSFIAHGRISTNNAALLNVHPIIRDEWHLIHNGVVTDHGPQYEMLTNNDSEHVLKHLIQGIDSLASSLTGYYAFLAIDPQGNFHVGRDKIAPLFVAWVPRIESYIYSTKEEDIKEIVKTMFWGTDNMSAVAKVQDDVYAVHKFYGGITWQRFNSLGRDEHSVKHSQASLGTQLESAKPEDKPASTKILELAKNTADVVDKRLGNGQPRYSSVYDREIEGFRAYDNLLNRVMTPEEVKADKTALFAAATDSEKKYLGEFFRFINSKHSTFEIWAANGYKVSPTWFLGLPASRQVSYEVVLPNGGYLDPFNGLFGDEKDREELLGALEGFDSDKNLQEIIENHRAQLEHEAQEFASYGVGV